MENCGKIVTTNRMLFRNNIIINDHFFLFYADFIRKIMKVTREILRLRDNLSMAMKNKNNGINSKNLLSKISLIQKNKSHKIIKQKYTINFNFKLNHTINMYFANFIDKFMKHFNDVLHSREHANYPHVGRPSWHTPFRHCGTSHRHISFYSPRRACHDALPTYGLSCPLDRSHGQTYDALPSCVRRHPIHVPCAPNRTS